MTETSRRKLIVAAGAGAAVGGVALTSGRAAAATATRHPDSAHETVVAYVKDHRSAELRLMVGEREVVVHDRDLVTRILNAAGGQ
ncbi:hypothetical protein [Nocardioides cynanchi]|uniref:hypothetical protein n=1 Tax=Nocardioides cynanchi TaxID=2558918 RepID=UPI0012482BEC|nr:hypothetical protein [Nocardioides cynanchi]